MCKKRKGMKKKDGQSNRIISSQSVLQEESAGQQLWFAGKYRGKNPQRVNLRIAPNLCGSKSPQLRVWPLLLIHLSCSETYQLRNI